MVKNVKKALFAFKLIRLSKVLEYETKI